MPSTVVGGAARRKLALNWGPWVRSLTQVPDRLNELAGADRRRVADHGHQVALAPRLDAQDAEAVVGVVEGDPLDEAGERLGDGSASTGAGISPTFAARRAPPHLPSRHGPRRE